VFLIEGVSYSVPVAPSVTVSAGLAIHASKKMYRGFLTPSVCLTFIVVLTAASHVLLQNTTDTKHITVKERPLTADASSRPAAKYQPHGGKSEARNSVASGPNHFLSATLPDSYACHYDDEIRRRGKRFALEHGPWRVALALRGESRGSCNEYLDRFIFSLPEVDIFIHHWSAPDEVLGFFERYSAVTLLVENRSITDSASELFTPVEGAPRLDKAGGNVPFFWGISKSLQLVALEEDRAGKDYDLVISTRWDLNQNHIGPIFFPGLYFNTSKLYSQFGPELNMAFYDQWFYSSSANMRKVSRVCDALLGGELYPRKHDSPENNYTKTIFSDGIPFSEAGNYWSNAVLSKDKQPRKLMISSNQPNDLRNVHLVMKIFMARLNLFGAENAMYCTDRAFEEYWRRRQLPEHGYFPWSNNPLDSSPNCIGHDSYFSADPVKARRGVSAQA